MKTKLQIVLTLIWVSLAFVSVNGAELTTNSNVISSSSLNKVTLTTNSKITSLIDWSDVIYSPIWNQVFLFPYLNFQLFPIGAEVVITPNCETNTPCFQPNIVTIEAGEEVTWINNDTIDHSVTIGVPDQEEGKFESGKIRAGRFINPSIYNTRNLFLFFSQ